MAYKGLAVPIPFGQGGLETDNSPSEISPLNLIVANNVTVDTNMVEKMGGSKRLNTSAIPNGVLGAFDWWPTSTPSDRRTIAVGGNGKIYAITDAGAVSEIPVALGDPAPAVLTNLTNQVFFMPCGAEDKTKAKKLFIFTGTNPVQVISGTTLERKNLSKPAADWSGSNQPTFGIIHKNRIFAGGNANDKFRMYVALASDHEDFTTTPQSYSVYPGEWEGLIGATMYKGRLFVFKYPIGVYYLVDSDLTSTNWFFTKTSEQFGFASAHSVVSALNDVLVKNASNSITSIDAVQEFGDIAAGDVLTILKIEQYVRDNTSTLGVLDSHGIYYADRKLAMFTYRSANGTTNDRILMFRTDVQGRPKATFVTKDAPNCLALRKDETLVERPIYGSLDGYVYLMDQLDRNVGGEAYLGEFQTPHLDFGFLQAKGSDLSGKNKHFDFLELRIVPQGNWNLYADIIIDGNLYETITFPLNGDDLLADDTIEPTDFMLAEDDADQEASYLAGEELITLRKQINGTGRTLSVRVYNSGLNETFKVAKMVAYFRPSGEQQR